MSFAFDPMDRVENYSPTPNRINKDIRFISVVVISTNDRFLKEELRKEHNEARKYRYWVNASLDDFEYEGEIFADNDTPVSFINSQEEEEVDITDFLDSLTEIQRRRLSYRMENPKITFREMAEKEHAAVSSIHETFKQIAKLFEKFQFSTRTN